MDHKDKLIQAAHEALEKWPHNDNFLFGFGVGADWQRNSVWNNANEEPEYNSRIIVLFPSGELVYGKYIGNFDYEICVNGVVDTIESTCMWCKAEDIYPVNIK